LNTVLVLQHEDSGGPGNLAGWLDERGIPWELVDVSAGSLPPARPRRAVVVLGSVESVYDPLVEWLDAEKAFLAQVIATGTPVLGLCFGGQLLADVLGGQVVIAEVAEIGWVDVSPVVAGDAGDIRVGGRWFAWHYDQFRPPPGSTVLAHSSHCVHAFRHGPHLGLQFHPEVTPRQVELWLDKQLRECRISQDEARRLLDSVRRLEPSARDAAYCLYNSFFTR
jgi:GMP synthase-like glutamine amidotransferase